MESVRKMVYGPEHLEHKPNTVHQAVKLGGRNMQEFQNSLQEQQRMFHEQQQIEKEIACLKERHKNIKEQRGNMIAQTEQTKQEALNRFSVS